MSETKWPVFIELCRVNGGIPLLYDESNHYHDALNYVRADAARAWAGLAMWCMCAEDFGSVECWRCGKSMPMQIAVAEEGDMWECHKCYRDLDAREEAQHQCRAWQALRDWLDGTAEQWMEMVRRHERMALGL